MKKINLFMSAILVRNMQGILKDITKKQCELNPQ